MIRFYLCSGGGLQTRLFLVSLYCEVSASAEIGREMQIYIIKALIV